MAKELYTMNVARLLRQKRENFPRKCTQRELSELLGTECGQTFSNYERGIQKVPLKHVQKILKALNISKDEYKKAWLKDREMELDSAISGQKHVVKTSKLEIGTNDNLLQ